MNAALQDRLHALAVQRRELVASLRENPRGLGWCEEHTALVDDAIQLVARDVAEGGMLPFCVVATGGYGRRELSPYSDVDLAVVPAHENPTVLDPAVKAFFRGVGEASRMLGLELGYAFLLISDTPGLDAKSRTGLIDARLIGGPIDQYARLLDALAETMSVGQFVLRKIQEREEAFAKYHDTPLVVEPQLKEGAGGLRCFQTASWIGTCIGRQALRPSRDYSYLLRIRNLLHLVTQRHQDLLTRARRDEIAEILDLNPYDLASQVSAAALQLHRVYEEGRASLAEARFALSRGVLAIRGEARVLAGADLGEAAAGIGIATDLGLKVEPVGLSTGTSIAGSAALYAVAHGEKTLRNLDDAGLLTALLPELARCRTLMSRDGQHMYTVFEHTLRVVRALDSIQEGYLRSIKDSITDLQPLYLAILLHDVGKVDPDNPHSLSGAKIAQGVCERWGLRPELSDLVSWLVLEHLTMAHFIQLRDLENPDTVRDFRETVGTQERLDMLTLLTWADVQAVSQDAWTAAQETFLRDLYDSTTDLMHAGDAAQESDMPAVRRRLTRHFQDEKTDEESVQAFIDSLPAHYLTSTPPSLVRLHYRLAEKARDGEPTVDARSIPELGATEFTICCKDSPALLSRLLGVLYAFDLSMVGVRASTSAAETPVALDVLTASFGGRVVPTATANQVTRALYDVIEGRQSVRELLTQRGKDADRSQRMFSYSLVPGSTAVLEIRSPRGRGMPYRFSRLFSDLNWNILAARVGQWADSAAAAFYLEGQGGRELTSQEVDAALAR